MAGAEQERSMEGTEVRELSRGPHLPLPCLSPLSSSPRALPGMWKGNCLSSKDLRDSGVLSFYG